MGTSSVGPAGPRPAQAEHGPPRPQPGRPRRPRRPRLSRSRRGATGAGAPGFPKEGRVQGRKGKQERYQVVIGSRRFEALRLLEERGELPEDFTVAVEVRDDLSKDQTLRIATVENLQRQNMTPLEEAAALTKLVHKGVTLDDVVAQTGLSATTIKRRLALNGLCKEAKALLAKGGLIPAA